MERGTLWKKPYLKQDELRLVLQASNDYLCKLLIKNANPMQVYLCTARRINKDSDQMKTKQYKLCYNF